MQAHSVPGKWLGVLSDIKVFKWPLFIVYRPRSFAIKGCDTREILKLVKPGDILVRSFNNYLNNYFMPGTFKHLGFYLSEVTEQHLKQFAHITPPTDFKTGKQMVIYAIGDKIFLEDLIDFCRCDGLAVMRFPRKMKSLKRCEIPDILQAYFDDPTQPAKVVEKEEETEEGDEASKKPSFFKKLGFLKKSRKGATSSQEETSDKAENQTNEPAKEPIKLDATMAAIVKAEKDIAGHIAQGKVVEFNKILKILYRIALMQLSTRSDYDFGMERFQATTCTELVYFITKSLCWNYGIEPASTRVFFKKRQIITPDAFVDGDLEEVWKSDI